MALEDNFCVISCIFGKKYKLINKAPLKTRCFCFTNNPELENVIKKEGWIYIYIDMPLSDDSAVSSFQSKYVKFHKFIENNEYKFFSEYDYIIYVDHRLLLKQKHIKKMFALNDRPILIRGHQYHKTTIWEEVGSAMHQERYLRYMPQTIDYIREKTKQGYNENVPICTTGLILYKNNEPEVKRLFDEIYRDLSETGTSECQIIWAIVSQKYTEIIRIIKWESLDIFWGDPKPLHEKIKNFIKMFFPLGAFYLLGKYNDYKKTKTVEKS